ncbi:MAG TPA: HAMP domain-containing protein, partial [Candidatus Binataceae bacterium]|nr:HAMP domain-containing protein [Candidatus Binataceae bacterium]
MVGLFILSALVPLCLCTGFLIEQFDAQMISTQRKTLDDLVRSFGMSLVARLGSADDVLAVIVSAPGASDGSIEDDVAKLPWARSVRRVTPGRAESADDQLLPTPDARQLLALKTARSIVLSQLGESGNPQTFIVRALPSGAWLYTEISSTWLWSDASDYATDAGLVVFDGAGTALDSVGKIPAGFRGATALPNGWTARSWEIFLRSRFSSPSWRVMAISRKASLLASSNGASLYLIAFALLTILLIAWLSMTVIRRQLHPLDQLTKATKRVAQRDFESFDNMSWNDEFGDLARSFQVMTEKLKLQFSALEMLAEVDRLLLHAPELESILGTLLPRMAALLHCDSLSVVLFDPDSNGHARAYDYDASESQPRPIRRIATDVAALKAACEQPSSTPISAAAATRATRIAPIATQDVKGPLLYKLEHDGHCAG